LSEHTVLAFLDGSLLPSELEVVDAHLERCEMCFALVALSTGAAASHSASISAPDPSVSVAPEERRPQSERFQPLEIIAWGGTSVVYRGWDWLRGRSVAIKRLEGREPPLELRQRFEMEGQLLGRLEHPNIVRLVATVAHADRLDLVLEAAPGSLRDLLQREVSLPVERALTLLSGVCAGLAAAHDLGIVHRDIKPDNVLLTSAGVPLLADFGSAQPRGAPPCGCANVVGTVAYLSPEAIRGQALDERADLWALGVVLFEILSGDRPFRGRTQRETLAAVLEQPTPSLRSLSRVPVGVIQLVERLLEKDRERRWGTARQVANEVEVLLRPFGRTLVGPPRMLSGRALFHGTRRVFHPLNAS
jgi:serine/threonine-protein kinase